MSKNPYTGEPDADLLRRLQAGERDAFDRLFERHRRGLRAYAAAILRDASLAEDVVQESFLQLAKRADELDSRRGVSGWLYRVARNRAIDVQRQRQPELQPGEAAVALARDGQEQAPSAADDVQRREQDAELMQAMGVLPVNEREVLAMHFYGGLAYREVADAIQRPLGTVLWLAHRGLRRLRKQLELVKGM